jgi:hypothetical protein
VVEPIAARKQRGRPLGAKNKGRKVNPNVGITVTPVSHADAVAIVSPSPEHSVTPLPITVADGDDQKQIVYDCSKWGDLR